MYLLPASRTEKARQASKVRPIPVSAEGVLWVYMEGSTRGLAKFMANAFRGR